MPSTGLAMLEPRLPSPKAAARINPARKLDLALRLLICFGLAAVASLALGQDANWDLRNYHIYNPYALLHGRLGIDLMPAGIQSTLNPLLDVPYYVLATGLLQNHPRAMAAVAGLPFGALLFVVLQLATWLLSPCERARRFSPYIAAAIAGTAAATSSEIGTTFNDIPIAAMILGAFLIGARAIETERFQRVAAAGALTGAAMALKPTAMVFAPGELAALLALGASWEARGRVVIAFTAGAAMAGLAVGAPWALLVMHRYGSPLFPLMNAVFRSDWYPPKNLVDVRFLPRTVWQDVFYPFFWLHRQTLVTENPERDARMALATLALLPIAASIREWKIPQARRMAAVILFAVVSYVPWMLEFSILRYAIVLEALAALLIMAGVHAAAGWITPRRASAAPLMGCCVLACLVLHTERPDWWRIPYGRRVLDIERVALPPKSLVVVVSAPMAMVLPFLDTKDFSAVGLTGEILLSKNYRLLTEIVRRIDEQRDAIFILTDEEPRAIEDGRWFGLTVDPGSCKPIRVNISFNAPIVLCPVRRGGASK